MALFFAGVGWRIYQVRDGHKPLDTLTFHQQPAAIKTIYIEKDDFVVFEQLMNTIPIDAVFRGR
ncbi:hypothetical protein SDC9_109052 [bioreactor metagenome]|uniref:Uncharacterized protein n=1 Tax=bioreactor metagenome TaxID=1076179 RepID=A0A645BAT5_9ZZZZ